MDTQQGPLEYAGFWIRLVAVLLDSLLFLILIGGLVYVLYGTLQPASTLADAFFNYILPAALTVFFWVNFCGTPGKLALSMKVVDADSGQPLATGKAVIRYVAYIVSMLPLFLGFVWIAFDRRKQAWHDKLANSVVVRRAGTEKVSFPGPP